MIKDQAERLRELIQKRSNSHRDAEVIGVLSGKGGVGKSVFCTNFAITLSKMDKKVLIIDLDLGMGNIEQLLGLRARYSVVDCIRDRLTLSDVIFRGPGNISFIPGGGGFAEMFRFDGQSLDQFLQQLDEIKEQYDFIVFDFGAGVSEDMIHFLMAVHQKILITTPDPPAMADGYSALKMVTSGSPGSDFFCVVNMVERMKEGRDVWERLSNTAQTYLHTDVKWLAALHRDRSVSHSVREQIPCVIRYPKARYSIEMQLLAGSFLAGGHDRLAGGPSPSFSSRVRSYFRMFGGKKT